MSAFLIADTFTDSLGERIKMVSGIGGAPVTNHSFRAKDVEYVVENDREERVAILMEEERDPARWPHRMRVTATGSVKGRSAHGGRSG